MTHVTSRSWTNNDIIKLKALSASGASVTRAAAALNRQTTAVQKVARKLNLPLIGTRQAKAAIRAAESLINTA